MTYPSGGREPGTEGEFHDELLREQAQGDAAAANPEDRTAAHWLRAIDQLDEDIRVSTRRSRAARKASGWFVLGASAFSAVALAVQMVSDWLDLPASVMDVLFGALGVGLVLSLPGLILWTLLHDLNVRSVRRAGWRLTEPGSPGGETMVALYRHWWDRMEENRNPRWGFGGRAELVDPRDPEWSADRIMRQSKAVPGVLCQAWEETRGAAGWSAPPLGDWSVWACSSAGWRTAPWLAPSWAERVWGPEPCSGSSPAAIRARSGETHASLPGGWRGCDGITPTPPRAPSLMAVGLS